MTSKALISLLLLVQDGNACSVNFCFNTQIYVEKHTEKTNNTSEKSVL